MSRVPVTCNYTVGIEGCGLASWQGYVYNHEGFYREDGNYTVGQVTRIVRMFPTGMHDHGNVKEWHLPPEADMEVRALVERAGKAFAARRRKLDGRIRRSRREVAKAGA